MNAETAPDLVVGIDIGGTGIKGAAVDVAAGKLAAARVRVPTPKPATPQSVSEVAGEVLQQIGAAEDWAAGSIRENDHLSWKKYAHRLKGYLELIQHLLWPELIIIGGGVSKKADKFLPRIELQTPVVPAELHNDAGIIGAALLSPQK